MSIQRKKMAFIKSIREQQLNNYFKQCRKQLEQQTREDQKIIANLQSLFDQLPSSIMHLLQQLYQHRKLVSPFLYKELKQFCNRMVGSQNVEWCYFVSAINYLLANTEDRQIIKSIITDSLLLVLESGEMQLSKASNALVRQQIMITLMEYCYRLGGYIQILHQLQQITMVNTLKTFWDYNWSQEGELSLLTTSINIFKISFDEDNMQNITNQERIEAETTKIRLIKMVFYDCGNEKNDMRLQKIIGRMMELLYLQNLELLTSYLRLLVNFTSISQQFMYYKPLLCYNILFIISSITIAFKEFKSKDYSKQVMILNIRLLNNLLVNEVKLTIKILQEILLSKFIELYYHQPISRQIQAEIAELFINLAHFVNDQQEVIRNLIEMGITQMMIKTLQIFSQRRDDNYLKESVSVLFIFLNHNPIEVKKIIRQNQKMLRHIVEEQVSISDMLQDILKNCIVEPVIGL